MSPRPRCHERLAAVIQACRKEPDRSTRRWDEALFRLLLGSAIRRAECAAIMLRDLDIARGRVRILGKGAKLRHAAFGMKTGMALRRYLQARQGHPRAALDALLAGQAGPAHRQRHLRRSPPGAARQACRCIPTGCAPPGRCGPRSTWWT